MKLHNNYLDEIEKLKQIAKRQYNEELITVEKYNLILFTLFDKVEIYKKNIIKIKLPNINIENYKNIDVLNLTETLFSTG